MTGNGRGWIAFHLHYHEDLRRVLLDVVRPAARELLGQGAIDGFFFIRYAAGGPHVRLRLCVRPGGSARVAEVVESAARQLFARQPSRRRFGEETLRRASARLAAEDPTAAEIAIQADNTCCRAPFSTEVERYGGRRYLPASLGLFALSSVAALRFVDSFQGASRGRVLAVSLGVLLRQALGFAANGDELRGLLRYGLDVWGARYPSAADQGLRSYEAQRETLEALWHQEVDRRLALDLDASLATAGEPLAIGSLRLSRMLGRRDEARRSRVGWSQLHMTANRLGLRNSEEVYLAALLAEVLGKVRARCPEPWRRLERALGDANRQRLRAGPLDPGLRAVLAAGLGPAAP